MRRVSQFLGLGVLAGAALVLAVIAVATGPYLRDDLLLDKVVRSVALDWRDFGEDSARSRLQYELDRQSIGMQVGDDDCTLKATDDGLKSVRCDWGVTLRVPATEFELPLAFSSVAVISVDGHLR